MMDFIKDQWYEYDGCYLQFMGVSKTGKNQFRYAGEDCNIYIDVEDKLKPSSLLPDFSNAKVGDECWGYDFNNQSITFISEDTVQVKYESKSGFDQTAIFWKNGKIYGFRTYDAYGLHYLDWESAHPSLFNSFAQFQAYWDEEALKMKGGKDA